ncbi:hypothetical protein Taro_023091, partial [Colocasia esculenta]|nr:hypothetical protein [Colocasia esculenta]
PEAEVIALSPKTLLATNRFLCEICGKGFQRDQNLQLHRRGHNLPWKLRQRSTEDRKKRVYVCPEKSCIHHHPSRALGDLTGIKKHFCRKHGEKKWKCDKCSKRYAVQSDWKAHSKTCGTRQYRCDCGTLFSRRDSFITHRAFCDALAAETARICATAAPNIGYMAPAGGGYRFSAASMRPNLVQHFPFIFKPVVPAEQGGPGGVPQWAAQESDCGEAVSNRTNLNHLGHRSPASLFSDPFGPLNTLQLDYQHGCVYSNKMPSSSSGKITCTSLITSNMKEAAAQHHLLEVTAPFMYSSSQQQHNSKLASDKSATALLQKAAQIGVESSEPSLLGSFEVKKYHSLHSEEGNNFSRLFTTNWTAVETNLQINRGCDLPVLNQPAETLPSKHHVVHKDDDLGGGQTRDFLGVGVQALCPLPNINTGWI